LVEEGIHLVTALRPEVGRAVAGAIAKGLAKNPSDRFDSAGELNRAMLAEDPVPAVGRHNKIAVDANNVVTTEQIDPRDRRRVLVEEMGACPTRSPTRFPPTWLARRRSCSSRRAKEPPLARIAAHSMNIS
jgi:hypothetical protein